MRIGNYTATEPPLSRDVLGTLYGGYGSGSASAGENSAQPLLIKVLRSLPGKGSDATLLGSVRHPLVLVARIENTRDGGHVAVLTHPGGVLLTEKLAELRAGGLWGRHQMMRLIIDVCRAVEALHAAHIVHGALHPAGVVVSEANGQSEQGTAAHLMCFEPFTAHPTADYMDANDQLPFAAQEQLRGGGDAASDVYAVGMLLYVAFGAGLPFKEGAAYSLAEQIVRGDYAPFEPYLDDLDDVIRDTLGPDLETLGTVIGRALQRQPDARYGSIGELRSVLEQIARRLSPMALARSLYLSGDIEPTVHLLQQIEKHPATPTVESLEAAVLQGRIHGMLSHYEDAVKAFKRAITYAPNDLNARLGLATLYLEHDRHALAKREYNELMSSHPGSLEVRMGYARSLALGGNLDGALNVLRKMQQASPYFLPVYQLAVEMGLQLDNLKEAEIDCRNAIQQILDARNKGGGLAPEQVAITYYQRGVLLNRRGNSEKAIEWLKNALEQAPYHLPSHRLLTELYADMGQLNEAVEHFLFVLNADPDQSGIMNIVGRLFGQRPGDDTDSTGGSGGSH